MVICMKASSREACWELSSCSTIPCRAASSPSRSGGSPSISSVPLPDSTTTTPSVCSTSSSRSRSGERIRTKLRELSRMKSAIEVSASSLPWPMTIKWSAVRAISLIRCDETKIVRPSAARVFIRFLIQ